MTFSLEDFVRQSNMIEGISRDPSALELRAHQFLLSVDKVKVADLTYFVSQVQPGAVLRDRFGLDVRVGSYYPPPGGADIVADLEALLVESNTARLRSVAYSRHQSYETLHPFTDGNGRSGRALWLRDVGGIDNAPLGFLHHWYYQSLQFGGPR
jgi:hypothetical protein